MIGKNIFGYKILSKIGEGGMGTVYLAEHFLLGKFAIKALAPDLAKNRQFQERFSREAKAQFALQHENIVRLYTFFKEADELFIVMEYVGGNSLDACIEQNGPLPEDRALSIFKDALAGLNCAHSKGVVHRDVKPSNILLTRDGTAKIVDFGIALMAGVRRILPAGLTLGTPHYTSPEQIKRPKTIDHRSDVYSMGVVLYEMLTGKVPFDGESDFEVYQKHVGTLPPPGMPKDGLSTPPWKDW